MEQIPITPSEGDEEFSCTLGGKKFLFRNWWCEEMQSRWLDIQVPEVDLVLKGQRVSVGFDFLLPHMSSLGGLIVLGPEHEDVTFDSFGDTHLLYWISPEELNAL
jgi:hypothetical protein